MTDISTATSIAGSIELTHPEWLWLLALLFLATLIWRAVGIRKQASSLAMGSANTRHRILHPLISLLPKNQLLHKTSFLRIMVYGLAMTCIVISLAEPVRIGERLPDPPQQRDIVFIVDTSISMILRDYVVDGARIDRMTLLKGVLDRFVQQLPGERIGIIVFGDEAYTLVPLTRDQDLLRRMLSRIQATMVGRFSNVGEAIALAVKQTRQQQQAQRHRVLVLLTDVDAATGSIRPDTAAELAFEAGLPLYTVAIGATTAAADEQRNTGLIYAPVDLALLKAISERTGAHSYQAGDAHALEQAINDISQHETNKREQAPRYYREPLYLWPLLAGIALLVLSIISAMFGSVLASKRSIPVTPPKAVTRTGNVRQ
jgi:Ca-activated chloride channel family protein